MRTLLISSILTVSLLSISRAGTIFVNAEAAGRNTGRSWEHAYVDLQDALARAGEGDEVWVAKGTYLPTVTLNRDAAFSIPSGVSVFGGFFGIEQGRDERDWAANATVLSGNLGEPLNDEDNSYHVVEVILASDQTVLDGFTITGAYNERPEELGRGGGMYFEFAYVRVLNCRIERNFAGGGGGLWIQSSTPRFLNCQFVRNSNRAVSNSQSQPVFQGCLFEENTTWHSGAGVADYSGSASSFYRCRFIRNASGREGAAFFGQSGISVFMNCLFLENVTVDSYGGAVYLFSGRARVTNCTFVANRATRSSGGFSGRGDFSNCVFWGNRAGGTTEENQLYKYPETTINYCCIEGWTGEYGGVGNIGDDPNFALDQDVHLSSESLVIDAGTNDPPGGLPDVDLDGNPRSLDGDDNPGAVADMGTFEFNPARPSIAVSPSVVSLVSRVGGKNPEPFILSIRNTGGGALHWRISEECSWLDVTPNAGESSGEIDEVIVTIRSDDLGHGHHVCALRLIDEEAVNSPRTAIVELRMNELLRVPEVHPTIQSGIDYAIDGDEVVLADGVYRGHGNRDVGFRGKAIIVRSAGGPGNCIVDCQGTMETPHRAFTFHREEDELSIIRGLTMTNGYATEGGAIVCMERTKARIEQCIIAQNSAGASGGGLFCSRYFSSPTIADSIVSDNRSVNGGGIYCDRTAELRVLNCTIQENHAEDSGGGLYCDEVEMPIYGCSFIRNVASSGGGIYSIVSDPVIAFTLFDANRALNGGGMAIYNFGYPKMYNCTFRRNHAVKGGALHVEYDAGGFFVNSVFHNNEADEYGGVMFALNDVDPRFMNSVVTENRAGLRGGAVFGEVEADPRIMNSILWNNEPDEIVSFGGTPRVSYSNVKGGWPGEGNINADPLFVSPSRYDYALGAGSPCVDAGNNELIAEDWADLDNDDNRDEPVPVDKDLNPRRTDDPDTADTGFGEPPIVDMGAFEYQVGEICRGGESVEKTTCKTRRGAVRRLIVMADHLAPHVVIRATLDTGQTGEARTTSKGTFKFRFRRESVPPCGPNGVAICDSHRAFECGC